MIQRIQSVYLILGASAMGVLFLLGPLWSGTPAQQFGWFTPVVAVLAGLTAVGALVAIFLYQNRKRQRAAVAGLQVLAALTTVVLFASYFGADALGVRTAGGAFAIAKGAFLALPVLAYGLLFLARRAIRRDIELVRSMDRLR